MAFDIKCIVCDAVLLCSEKCCACHSKECPNFLEKECSFSLRNQIAFSHIRNYYSRDRSQRDYNIYGEELYPVCT